MAEIEFGPLTDRLGDDEIAELMRALERAGAPKPPKSDEVGHTVEDGVDDDVLQEFLDRLEAHDIAADIYLPCEFDSRIDVGDRRVGSIATLLEVLDEMKDDLGIVEADEDDEEDEEDEEEYDLDLIEDQLRQLWKVLYAGAEAALERKLPLYVRGD
jgi:hypothetical protein